MEATDLTFELIPDDFDDVRANLCSITVCIADDAFTYILYNITERCIEGFGTEPGYAAALSPADNFTTFCNRNEALLNLNFRKYVIATDRVRMKLVPERFYDRSVDYLATDYLSDQVIDQFEPIRPLQANLLYHADAELHKAVHERFPAALHTHISAAYLKAVYLLELWQDEELMYLDIGKNYARLAVFRNKQLLLFKHLIHHDKEADILYQVLAAGKNFRLDMKKVVLRLSGRITPEAPLHVLLKRYIKNVNSIYLTSDFNLSTLFGDFRADRYFAPLSAAVCES